MKAVIQRVSCASVSVENEVVGKIDDGFVVLLGITHEDTERDVHALVQKIVHLRVFEDEEGKLNRSLIDTNGSILSISQFTLYGDVRKGRRPNFMQAAKPHIANEVYELFNEKLRQENVHVETGTFGAMMDVSLTNHGPVTIIIETEDGKIV
ncbi:MAG TPA: D-aminoacyl-tRNA deacylase [Pseudogracilibacillus sp.]|nr:D-aminoacyl-tRNA deacylase [Pseudogracilibacillus sp.]